MHMYMYIPLPYEWTSAVFLTFAFLLALAEFGEVVRVQPELRSRAIADRFYNAVKSTPYAYRCLIVQAVHGTEIRHTTAKISQSSPRTSAKSTRRREQQLIVYTRGRSFTSPRTFVSIGVPGSHSSDRRRTALRTSARSSKRTCTGACVQSASKVEISV